MMPVQKVGIILKKAKRKFESHGVMTPETIQQGEDIHLNYLTVGKGHQSTISYCRGKDKVSDSGARSSPICLTPCLNLNSNKKKGKQVIWYFPRVPPSLAILCISIMVLPTNS